MRALFEAIAEALPEPPETATSEWCIKVGWCLEDKPPFDAVASIDYETEDGKFDRWFIEARGFDDPAEALIGLIKSVAAEPDR